MTQISVPSFAFPFTGRVADEKQPCAVQCDERIRIGELPGERRHFRFYPFPVLFVGHNNRPVIERRIVLQKIERLTVRRERQMRLVVAG